MHGQTEKAPMKTLQQSSTIFTSFISHTQNTRAPVATPGPPRCVGSRPTAALRTGAYEMRALDERRAEQWCIAQTPSSSLPRVCLYASAGKTAALQHAVILSPPKPPTILLPLCTLAVPALIPRHAHTGFPCLFTQYPESVVYQTAAFDRQQNCDPGACRVQGL